MANEFCPKIKAIDDELVGLDYNDRLKLIKEEAKSLYSFCLKKGFSEQQLKECVSSLNGPQKKLVHQILIDSYRSLFAVIFVVGVLSSVWMSSVGNNIIVANFKIASAKLIPFWDWSIYYNEECLINNIWLPKPNVTYDKYTCKYCIDVVTYGKNVIDRMNNASHNDIVKHYINNLQPVIISDATKDWDKKKKLNAEEIIMLYLHNMILSQSLSSCNYSTNTEFNGTYYEFFNAYNDNKLPEKWHATWDNCLEKAGKVLRKYYTRPYFLPQMVQCTLYNKIIFAKGLQDEWFQFDSGTPQSSAVWMTVLEGGLNMQLQPFVACKEKHECLDAEIKVTAGETVFVPERNWKITYTPAVDGITIAIANPVIWDEQ